jgi:FAD/FMN-containing dehydrogenase
MVDPEPHPRRKFLKNSTHLAVGNWVLDSVLPETHARAAENATPAYYVPGQRGYETARQPFNSDIALQPALIAACENDNEVVAAVERARSEGLPISVKSRGHSFEGFSLNDGGLVIELSRISQPRLTADHRFLSGTGIKLGDVYRFLLPKGRLLPAGSCSGVGLGGLTLGGGYGLFARQHGLTCDLLERVRMVDGRGRIIDSRDDPDLLWACRGGGNGNFGAITAMEFRTVEASAQLSAQRFIARTDTVREAEQKAAHWFTMAEQLPDPIFSALVINGKAITVLLTSTFSFSGPAFQNAASALRSAGFSSKGASRSATQTAIQRYYGRQEPLPFRNFCGGLADSHADYAPALPAVLEEVHRHSGLIAQFNTLGGMISRAASGAYPHRERQFLCEVQAYWESSAQRERLITGVSKIREHLAQHISAHYRNYPSIDFPAWERAYYGDNYAKLQQLKLRYDPENLFRHPQSVRLPAQG